MTGTVDAVLRGIRFPCQTRDVGLTFTKWLWLMISGLHRPFTNRPISWEGRRQ